MAPYKQQNPLEFLLDVNQKAGTAVLQGAHSLLIDNPVAEGLAANLNRAVTWGIRNSIAGKADEAATQAGGDISEFLGGPRWLGEFAGGLAVPGPPVASLKIGDDAATILRNYGKRPHDTALSNVITPSHVDPKSRIFGRYRTVDGVKSALRHPEAHANIDTPIFHHIVGKKVRWRFQQKMETFDPKGKNRLETIDNKYNLESGSGEKAGYPMDDVAHKIHHFESRLEGIEPFDTKGNKTLSKLKKLIDNAESPEELEELYELYITASVLPDFDHAIKFQRGYEILGSRPDVLREELIKVSNEWGNRMKDIESVKADIRMEDLHQAAIDLVESTKKFRN
jgi:hypothetical protein